MDHRNSTPRARPSLKFANRSYQASPLNPNKRLGTPQTAPSQRVLNRDPIPSSNLNTSTISTAHNLFRSSSISASPAVTPFAPSLSSSAVKKVFAPGATPASQKVYRETIAQATPRGLSAKSTSADLFQMRIPSPPPELTGEALARDIPPELEAQGTVYADQYLGHLVPSEYDDLQRRQLFCVLDLRRLKYAANEIFAKKDWKLNIMNFAKEFEKSRSLIMLRYGLYEFKNVKPSEEVLKKWRSAHGLPEPEEETADASPSRQTTRSKRKAEEQLTPKDAALSAASANKNKRRVVDREEDQEPVATPVSIKNKRNATVSDEADENQPSKLQKPTSTPSATKNMFERIANNQGPSSTPKAAPKAAEPKPNPFAAAGPPKGANGAPARSVFENLKAPQASNIFGYLSDASSAKNSGVEADGESETSSEEEAETQEAGQQSYEPSVAASGGAETPLAQPASNLFGAKKPLFSSGVATGPSSTSSDARETTPGRSLFDRVSKGNGGQPLRADSAEPTPAADKGPSASDKAPAPAPVNATWNPNSPIKFNASAPAGNGLFGASTNGSSSLFGAKPAAPASNLFGAPKQDEKPKAEKRSAPEEDKGSESDKENSSQPPAKSPFGGFGSSGFQPKVSSEPKKDAAASKPAAAPTFAFGASAPKVEESKPSAPTSNLFGSQDKPAGSVMQSSTLFGGNTPQGTPAAPAAEPAKPLFGASTSSNNGPFQSNTLFGNKAPEAAPAPAAAPVFSFGASKPAEPNPLFGSQKPDVAPVANSPFGGSPMKHDGPPATQFNAPSSSAPSGGMFNFGGSQSAAPANPFGGSTSTPQANGGSSAPPSFGGGGGGGGSSFTFSAGGGQSFNNPFASNNGGGSDPAPAPSSGGMFNFSGGSAAPSNGSSPFQFGGGGSSSAAPSSNTSFQFGGGAPAQPAAPTPTFAFGASNGSANAPAPASQKPLFGAATSAPTSSLFGAKPAQPASGMFGNLQPPAGASTTGTNSPFNFGGASSLATTPATGTPEPEKTAASAAGGEGDDADGKPHEQIKLTDGGPGEEDETVLHDVRAKVMKFIHPGSEEDKDSGDDRPKNKSPWSTKGVGPFRLLQHKTTGAVRMLLRAEPRGHVVLNRTVLPGETYKADKKYVRLMTSNETGNGIETWMVQVKNEDLAKALAGALESHKSANAK
ncbi:hypothetical protein EsH8_V_000424 [Colletotrichum jinshuiense]